MKYNSYKTIDAVREEFGIGYLPKDLNEAIQIAKSSEWLRKTLGDNVYYKLIENKEMEWESYRAQVTRLNWRGICQ